MGKKKNSKIVLPKTDFLKNVTVHEPVYTEEYLQLVKEADERIIEGRRAEARAWQRAKNFRTSPYSNSR